MRVFLGGEGPNELGGWYAEHEYRAEEPDCGILEALLRRVRPNGWAVVGAVRWMSIRKYRVGKHGDHERRNVEALALMARESGADVVAFCRDSDGDRERAASVEAGIAGVAEKFPGGPRVAGGVAEPTVEAWVLALTGRRGCESASRTRLCKDVEAVLGRVKATPQYVAIVEAAELAAIPADAASLLAWLERARVAMGVPG